MNNCHTFVLDATEVDCRQQILFPMLKESIKKDESFMVTSSGGKLYDYLSPDLYERGYKVIYMDFSDSNSDWQWNPLQYPYKLYRKGDFDSSYELISMLASVIMGRDTKIDKVDPFWANAAAELFEALVLSLYKIAEPQEIHLLSVLDMAIEGSKGGNFRGALQDYFNLEQCSEFYKRAATYLNASSDTRGSIISVFIQGLSSVCGNSLLGRHLINDTINLQRIPDNKTAIIVNISEASSYTTLIGTLVTQIYHIILRNSESRLSKKRRFAFYLDRFLSLGRISQIERILSFSLDCKTRFVLFADSISMLENVYSSDYGKVIREYCARWIIYPTRNLKILEELNSILDTYAGDKKEKLLNELRNNKPIVIDEDQRISPYTSLNGNMFTIRESNNKRNNFIPQEPAIFSIVEYTRKQKKHKLILKEIII